MTVQEVSLLWLNMSMQNLKKMFLHNFQIKKTFLCCCLKWSCVCECTLIQVWDVLKEDPVCNYRGHSGRLLCVQWSPVDPDLVWTGGDDFTIQEWAVSKQEHVRPPKSEWYYSLSRICVWFM